MKKLNKNQLIAPCGMNCGICLAFLRSKNVCPGCRADEADKPKSRWVCKIKTCVILKNSDYKYCHECAEFPCKRLKQLDKRYRTRYKMSMIDNLENIKKRGIRNFLKEERERWKCRECGGMICVHRGFCLKCKQY